MISLRVNCSYWTILCFTLLDNRRNQRERRCVMRCNEPLAVNSAPIPYRSLGIALRFTPNLIKGEQMSGLEPLDNALPVPLSPNIAV